MERTLTEYEIKGEFSYIREITTTYFTTSDGVEHRGNIHRAPQHVPGSIVNGNYVKSTDVEIPATIHALALHLWTPEVHENFEIFIRADLREMGMEA